MNEETSILRKRIRLQGKEFEMYISSEAIQARVEAIAEKINEDMDGKNPLFIGVLNGTFRFCADIFKHLTIECELSFVKISSYQGTTSSGVMKSLIGLNENIKDRTIVFIEDIIDSGETAMFLTNEINKLGPESVHWTTLLVKPDSLKYVIDIPYKGFEISNDFMVGYGLDYKGAGRNLNDLYKEVKLNI